MKKIKSSTILSTNNKQIKIDPNKKQIKKSLTTSNITHKNNKKSQQKKIVLTPKQNKIKSHSHDNNKNSISKMKQKQQIQDFIIINDCIYSANTFTERSDYQQFLSKVKKQKQIQRKSFLIKQKQSNNQNKMKKVSILQKKKKIFNKLTPEDIVNNMTLQQKKQIFKKLQKNIEQNQQNNLFYQHNHNFSSKNLQIRQQQRFINDNSPFNKIRSSQFQNNQIDEENEQNNNNSQQYFHNIQNNISNINNKNRQKQPDDMQNSFFHNLSNKHSKISQNEQQHQIRQNEQQHQIRQLKQQLKKFSIFQQKLQHLKMQILFKSQSNIQHIHNLFSSQKISCSDHDKKIIMIQKIKDYNMKLLEQTKKLFAKVFKQQQYQQKYKEEKVNKLQSILQSLNSFPSIESLDGDERIIGNNFNSNKDNRIIGNSNKDDRIIGNNVNSNNNISSAGNMTTTTVKFHNFSHVQKQPNIDHLKIKQQNQIYNQQINLTNQNKYSKPPIIQNQSILQSQNYQLLYDYNNNTKKININNKQTNISQKKQPQSSSPKKQLTSLIYYKQSQPKIINTDNIKIQDNRKKNKPSENEQINHNNHNNNYNHNNNNYNYSQSKIKQNQHKIFVNEQGIIQKDYKQQQKQQFFDQNNNNSLPFSLNNNNNNNSLPFSLKLDLRLDQVVLGQDHYQSIQIDQKQLDNLNIQYNNNKEQLIHQIHQQQGQKLETVKHDTVSQIISLNFNQNQLQYQYKQSQEYHQVTKQEQQNKYHLQHQQQQLQQEQHQYQQSSMTQQLKQQQQSLIFMNKIPCSQQGQQSVQIVQQQNHHHSSSLSLQCDQIQKPSSSFSKPSINIPLILTKDRLQNLQYQKNKVFKQNLDNHIAFQLGCIQYQNQQQLNNINGLSSQQHNNNNNNNNNKKVSQYPHFTTLVDINNYIIGFYQYLMSRYLNTMSQSLNMSYGKSVLDKFYCLQTQGYITQQCYNQMNNILTQKNFKQYQQNFTLTVRRSTEYQVIHNKAVFDAWTKFLNQYRPYYELEGEVYPWIVSEKGITFYQINQDNIIQVFEKSKFKVIEYCNFLCGVHPPTEIKNQDQKMLLIKRRQEALKKMIKSQINQTYKDWNNPLVNFQCLIRLLLAETIYHEEIIQIVKQFKEIQINKINRQEIQIIFEDN